MKYSVAFENYWMYDQLWHLAYLSPGTLTIPMYWGLITSRLPAAVLKYSAVNKVTLVCLTTLEAISHARQLSGSVNHPLSIPPSPTSFPGSGSCDSIVHLHEFNVYI